MAAKENQKPKIFVSAYACEPGKGSEIGVGWHWVLEMSKYFELWVMTRANNEEPITAWFAEHPQEERGIHWVYYDCPEYIKRFKHQMRGVRRYYTVWQHMSNGLVKSIMQENNIQIFHHLTYGNAIWNVSRYGQQQFFIWGPVGGAETIPGEFSKHYTLRQRAIEAVRRKVVSGLTVSPSFRKKCKNANLIFCKTDSMLQKIPTEFRQKAILFTDVAMEPAKASAILPMQSTDEDLTYISVGRLDGWRGFDLLIEAYIEAAADLSNVTLKIIGDGAEKKHLQGKISAAHLESRIILTGQLSLQEYQQEMKSCSVVINTCLKEGGVTNAFDCMTWAKPLLCIDTGGYTRNFRSECSIILQHTARKDLVHNLAQEMVRLRDESLRRKMCEAMIQEREGHTWEIKGERIKHEILKAWEKNDAIQIQ